MLETRATLKAAIGANAALAQLDQAAVAMPNPTVLINTIPLLEAQASSEIENVVTTTDALFRHMDDSTGADAATRETLRYRSALRIGFERTQQRGLTTATAIAVCGEIHGRQMDLRALPATRIGNPTTGEILYRTGRILNVLQLVEAGLLRIPLLYLSRYIIETKGDYYRLLRVVTAEAAWEEWILYVLQGVEQTSRQTLTKIQGIRDLQEDFTRRAREVSRGAVQSDFQAVLFEQPYCRIATVMDR